MILTKCEQEFESLRSLLIARNLKANLRIKRSPGLWASDDISTHQWLTAEEIETAAAKYGADVDYEVAADGRHIIAKVSGKAVYEAASVDTPVRVFTTGELE